MCDDWEAIGDLAARIVMRAGRTGGSQGVCPASALAAGRTAAILEFVGKRPAHLRASKSGLPWEAVQMAGSREEEMRAVHPAEKGPAPLFAAVARS